ncbi:MAG TPA: hypothetical protein VFV87_03100 [Pirellulaceae bacterium]|nr:hypothetical protein [Pirellulaceae bacterium]
MVLAFGSSIAIAEEPNLPRPYDGIQAGYDAFQLAEERRRADIAEQLFLNDQLKYWSGLPTSRGETIYYGAPYATAGAYYGSAAPVLPPANLDYGYAYGRWAANRPILGRGWNGPRTVFEPWPYIPGDIYGYTYYSPMRQPVGQQQVQTGENRWESHPVYDPPLPEYRPLPPVDSRYLDDTPFASPRSAPEMRALPPPAIDPPSFGAPGTDAELPPTPPKRRPREY